MTFQIRVYFWKLFCKSNRALFPRLHSLIETHRSWENSQKLCKPLTTSQVGITVSNSPNPPHVSRWGYVNMEKVLCCLIIYRYLTASSIKAVTYKFQLPHKSHPCRKLNNMEQTFVLQTPNMKESRSGKMEQWVLSDWPQGKRWASFPSGPSEFPLANFVSLRFSL